MKNDIDKYIKECIICTKVKKVEKSCKAKSKTILSKGPKDCYVSDLLYIPAYLKGKSYYYDVLDIYNHFAKVIY